MKTFRKLGALALLAPALFMVGCGTLLSEKIDSRSHGVDVSSEEKLVYRVYLPPGYESEPARTYPVLVWFHGGGGNEKTWGRVGGIGEQLVEPMKRREMDPFIVVSPTPGEFEVYRDGMERALFEKVLPRVNREYRTNGVTVAFGHSMGGLNALIVSLRNPLHFNAVAVASPFTFDTSPYDCEMAIAAFEKQFGGGWASVYRRAIKGKFPDREKFEAVDPFTQIRRSEAQPFPILLTSGTRDSFGLFPHNQRLHETMANAGIEHEWIVQENVGHGTVQRPEIYLWMSQQAREAQERLAATSAGGGGR